MTTRPFNPRRQSSERSGNPFCIKDRLLKRRFSYEDLSETKAYKWSRFPCPPLAKLGSVVERNATDARRR
ncbi:hypothetical protein PSP6_580017 [Paraburkholderia tropica]|nr:hypothetical protein PSP6_580017 [Paraburkholderia tropica]